MNINWKTVATSVVVTLGALYVYHHWIMKTSVVPQALVPSAS